MWITTSLVSWGSILAKRGRVSGQMTEEILQGVLQTFVELEGFINSPTGVSVLYPTMRATFTKYRHSYTRIKQLRHVITNCRQPSSRNVSLMFKKQRSQMTHRVSNGLAPHPGGLFVAGMIRKTPMQTGDWSRQIAVTRKFESIWRVLPRNRKPQTSNSRSSNRRHLYIQMETHQHTANSAIMQ